MTKARQKKFDNAILDCYRELYRASEPPGDFDYLMEHAEEDPVLHLKKIPFQDYEIEEEKFEEILQKYLEDKDLKLTEREKKGFSFHIYLGCSPRYKR
jgi:hypothetical protein